MRFKNIISFSLKGKNKSMSDGIQECLDKLNTIRTTSWYKMAEERREIFDVIYTLDQIHLYKPKIDDYLSKKGKTYISYIEDLFGVTEEHAVKILQRYNGDVYKSIVFA